MKKAQCKYDDPKVGILRVLLAQRGPKLSPSVRMEHKNLKKLRSVCYTVVHQYNNQQKGHSLI